jgi:hypothetical protein
MDQFTADPTARAFEGKIYVYPSHDIPASPGKGRANWFVMEDYHVFSSENLTDWKDHGVIVSQDKVDWANPAGYAMWAPDCVFKNGKYYFYFPAPAKTGTTGGPGGGSRIGVAIADKPYGPFKPEANPIEGPMGIDPCVLIDKDGTAYLYYAMGGMFVATWLSLIPSRRQSRISPPPDLSKVLLHLSGMASIISPTPMSQIRPKDSNTLWAKARPGLSLSRE